MNNEPVAWIIDASMTDCDDNFIWNTGNYPDCQVKDWIPLYTHPVKEYKEPSVKEIDDLWLDVVNNIPANDHRPREWHFAKAILRKAQEK